MIDQCQIQEMAETIRIVCHPRKILLFGSYARGVATENSDIDFMVVMDTKESPLRRALPIRRALRRYPVAKDIVVRTPDEYQEACKWPWSVVAEAHRDGKVLFEET